MNGRTTTWTTASGERHRQQIVERNDGVEGHWRYEYVYGDAGWRLTGREHIEEVSSVGEL